MQGIKMKQRTNVIQHALKGILILLLVFGMSACDNNTGKEITNTTTNHEETKLPSRGVVDDFADKLVLNGKKAKTPTSLKELGKGYSFGDRKKFIDYTNEDGLKCTLGDLLYKGKFFVEIALIDTNKKDIDENSIIYSFNAQITSPENTFSIGGLKIGSTGDEINKVLGKPSLNTDPVLQYFNGDVDGNERIVLTIRNNLISNIKVAKYPDKYRDLNKTAEKNKQK